MKEDRKSNREQKESFLVGGVVVKNDDKQAEEGDEEQEGEGERSPEIG
jgi:hypothetical protein